MPTYPDLEASAICPSAAHMLENLDGMLKGLGLLYPILEQARLEGREKFDRQEKDSFHVRQAIWGFYASALWNTNSAWVRSIVSELVKVADWTRIENHINRGQISSKKWLLEVLENTNPDLGRVVILGGWYGALAAILSESTKVRAQSYTNLDVDVEAIKMSFLLNRELVERSVFFAKTVNMLEVDYTKLEFDTLINTSCEHIPNFTQWLAGVPKGKLLCLQSNDYFQEPEHCNCVKDLEEFRSHTKLSEIYSGSMLAPNRKYTRFMILGKK